MFFIASEKVGSNCGNLTICIASALRDEVSDAEIRKFLTDKMYTPPIWQSGIAGVYGSLFFFSIVHLVFRLRLHYSIVTIIKP